MIPSRSNCGNAEEFDQVLSARSMSITPPIAEALGFAVTNGVVVTRADPTSSAFAAANSESLHATV